MSDIIGIERFKAALGDGLRPTKYKVEFTRLDGIASPDVWEKMSRLCKGTPYSYYTFDKTEVFENNTTQEHVNKINFEPVILRWYIDSRADILKLLYEWKKTQYDDESGKFGYKNDYVADIDVTLVNQNKFSIGRVTYHNAFPIAVDDIELGYDATDTMMEINVTFAYDYPTWNYIL